MQETQKSAAEPKPQRNRSLRLKLQRSIIQLQFLQGIPQIWILGAVRRVHTAVHHRRHLLIPWQWFFTGIGCVRHRISHLRIAYILETGSNIAYHACAQLFTGNKLARAKIADFHHIRRCSRRHHFNRSSRAHASLFHPAEHNHTLIRIIQRIKNQRLHRIIRASAGRRNLLYNLL